MPKSAGARDFVYTEDAGFVFTGPFELTAWRNGVPDEYETDQLTTRLQYITFRRLAPPRRGKPMKHCSLCWSRWLLRGEVMWQIQHDHELDDFAQRVRDSLGIQPIEGMGDGQPRTHRDLQRRHPMHHPALLHLLFSYSSSP